MTSANIDAPHNKQAMVSGLIFVLLGALGFSTKSILIKLAYGVSDQVDAISLLALRMLFALPFFLIVAVWHHKRNTSSQALQKKQWLSLAMLGMMGYYLASYLDFIGLQYISAGLERVILFIYPTFVVLLSAIASKRFITLREMLALALSYGGMVFVFIDSMTMESAGLILGSVSVLASAMVFACFMMGSGVMVKQIGSARFTAYSMTVASLVTLMHFVLKGRGGLTEFPVDVYWLALFLAVFSTVLPAFFMNAGVKRVGAGSASIISSAGPIATLALAFIILDEAVTAIQFFGTLLVLTGVYIVGRARA
ncbi:MAG: DMT family transporter [Gammaproteobacteria bacterium]